MNERHDELASAWIDGELDPSEERSVGDPAVIAARAELEAARRAIAIPVEAPADLADRQIFVATLELDLTAPGPPTPRARPGPLEGIRRSLLTQAAVVLVLVGAVGVAVAAIAGTGQDEAADVAAPAAQHDAAPPAHPEAAVAEGAAEAFAQPAPADHAAERAAGHAPGALADSAGPTPEEVAAQLLAQGELSAADLAGRLADRFGPPEGWLVPPRPARCETAIAQRHVDVETVVVVPVTLPQGEAELVVPLAPQLGTPYYLQLPDCREIG
jgi:hypothetical protein